jgi:hypothetical protein
MVRPVPHGANRSEGSQLGLAVDDQAKIRPADTPSKGPVWWSIARKVILRKMRNKP